MPATALGTVPGMLQSATRSPISPPQRSITIHTSGDCRNGDVRTAFPTACTAPSTSLHARYKGLASRAALSALARFLSAAELGPSPTASFCASSAFVSRQLRTTSAMMRSAISPSAKRSWYGGSAAVNSGMSSGDEGGAGRHLHGLRACSPAGGGSVGFRLAKQCQSDGAVGPVL